MNNRDKGIIAELATDAGLTIGGTAIEGRQLVLVYADEKHKKPRTVATITETLFRLMRERGVMYGIRTSNSPDSEFPTLIFTRHEQVVRHE